MRVGTGHFARPPRQRLASVRGLVAGVMLAASACAAPAPVAPAAATSAPASGGPTTVTGSVAAPAASAKPSAAPAAAPSASAQGSPVPATPAAAAAASVVQVTTAPGSPNDQPLWVAIDAGLMRANGLDVQLISAPANQGIASLVSGSTEIASTGGAEALGGLAGGADLVIVANLVPVIPWQFYGGPSISSVNDLRGKKIGITTAGASYDTALRLVLPKFGLDPDRDVTLITTGSIPNVTAALYSGAIDGAPLVVTPASFKAVEAGGFHEVFDFAKEAGAYPGDVTAVRRDWLTSHRDVVQRYVDALVQGVARFKRDRPYAVSVASKYLDEPDEALVARTYDYFASSVTPSQPEPTPEQFADVLQSLIERNDKARGIDLSRALDPSFVRSAVARGLDR